MDPGANPLRLLYILQSAYAWATIVFFIVFLGFPALFSHFAFFQFQFEIILYRYVMYAVKCFRKNVIFNKSILLGIAVIRPANVMYSKENALLKNAFIPKIFKMMH